MRSITIPVGKDESEIFTLAHWKLDTIFAPGTDPVREIEILGGHDKEHFGSINGGLVFDTQNNYSVHTFPSDMFNGIQYIKLLCTTIGANKDEMVFLVNLKDT